MNLSGLGRNGDVLRWLQMILQQSQSPRGQVPVARPLGMDIGGTLQNDDQPQMKPEYADAGIDPSEMQTVDGSIGAGMADPFDVKPRGKAKGGIRMANPFSAFGRRRR